MENLEILFERSLGEKNSNSTPRSKKNENFEN